MVRPVEPVFTGKNDISRAECNPSDIIFCEECGARNIVGYCPENQARSLTCRKCGDLLEVSLVNKYKRINCLTVIGSGLGGYRNLLQIIPQIPEDMNGAIVIVLTRGKRTRRRLYRIPRCRQQDKGSENDRRSFY